MHGNMNVKYLRTMEKRNFSCGSRKENS